MPTTRTLRRALLSAAAAAALGYLAFLLARPALASRLRDRLEHAARARGFTLAIGSLSLSPWLGLELRDVSLARAGRLELVASSIEAWPRLSPWSLIRPAADVRVAAARVRLPRALELDVSPSRWTLVRLLSGWRLERRAAGETLWLAVKRRGGGRGLELRAVAARPSALVRLLVKGCSVGDPGIVDGELRLDQEASGGGRLALRARAEGAAIRSLAAVEAAGCEPATAGAANDVELAAEASWDGGAGDLRVESARLVVAGSELRGRLGIADTRTKPRLELTLDARRLDFGRLLAFAGIEPSAQPLGSASFSLDLRGPLYEPAALTVDQRLRYTPPAVLPEAVLRLRGPFIQRAQTADGRQSEILVSAGSPDFLPFAEVPPLFLRALLLGEDAGFYGHSGLDLGELPAAFATNLVRGRIARGGSTIPQQLAKNLFLSRRRTFARKIEEAALALLIDHALGKERVLEIYLNVIEWGPGVYGLRPAARHYFGREPAQLGPRQMALLVCLIPGPVKYQRSLAGGRPTPFFEGLMRALLDKLAATGSLTPEEHALAVGAPLGLRVDAVPAGAAPDEGEQQQQPPAQPLVDAAGATQ